MMLDEFGSQDFEDTKFSLGSERKCKPTLSFQKTPFNSSEVTFILKHQTLRSEIITSEINSAIQRLIKVNIC